MSASVSVSQYAAASASIGVAMAENVIGYDVNSAGQVVALGAASGHRDRGLHRPQRRHGGRGQRGCAQRLVQGQRRCGPQAEHRRGRGGWRGGGVGGLCAARRRRRQPGRSGAGAGARAVNKIQTGITARISDQNQQNRFEAGSVTVRALDQPRSTAPSPRWRSPWRCRGDATAALSVAASLAQNEIGNTTLATMDGLRDRRRAGDHGQGRQPGRHHDRVGRGVGERGRGPGRRRSRAAAPMRAT